MTSKGVRILVASGLALAMLQAYYCARVELLSDRGNPIGVRDAFESAQRMVAHWLPSLRNLDAQIIPEEINNNIQRDGNEGRDLSAVKERIPKSKDQGPFNRTSK